MATGLELIQLTAIVLTILYYLLPIERPDTERALVGILSGVSWFIVTLLTAWEIETGYTWAYFYLALALLMSLQAVVKILQIFRQGGARY